MAYKGILVPITLGSGGLHTDDPDTLMPPGDLSDCSNITLYGNRLSKASSSRRFNLTAIPGGVYATFDWWPTDDLANRILVVVGGDGNTYFVNEWGQVAPVPANPNAPVSPATPAALKVSNQIVFCVGGNEQPGSPRLLFIFDGFNYPQVIVGIETTRQSLSNPDGGWVVGENMPGYGFLQNNSLCVMGGIGNTSIIYISDPASHQTFDNTQEATIGVYPGEGTGLVAHAVIGGATFVFKSPSFMYQLTTAGASSTWYAQRSLQNVGIASPHAIIPTINDVFVMNSSGQLNSIATVLEFGNVKSGDLFAIMKIEQFLRNNVNLAGIGLTHGIYYAEKKLVYVTFASSSNRTNNRLLELRIAPDVHSVFVPGQKPLAVFTTKDAPNCLALRRDTNEVPRPIYGSLDGYVYLMDQPGNDVNGVGFVSSFQTPNIDFGFADVKLANINKNFDRLEVRCRPAGTWTLSVDVTIDGKFYETITIQRNVGILLGDKNNPAPSDFMLSDAVGNVIVLGDRNAPAANDLVLNDSLVPSINSPVLGDKNNPVTYPINGSYLEGPDTFYSLAGVLHGRGRTIQLRIYNAGVDQPFEIDAVYVGFRPAGQEDSVAV